MRIEGEVVSRNILPGPTSETSDKYRLDIDGLRALAVLPVVLFHAGISGFQGGFIGVDVFFVISGYLITGILIKEKQRGNLSIARFYERRLRRIAPALLAVLTVSAIAAQLLLLPSQNIEFAKTLIASEAFVSNIWFWRGAGYFQTSSSIIPLLHTWSLAVEEQFYLGVPVLIALLGRRKRVLRWSILCLSAISFLVSCAGVELSPSGAFYLIPSRAWELFAGSILATGLLAEARSPRVAEPLGLLGIALIVVGVLGLSEQVPFPGALALIPCLGACAIIHASRIRDTIASRVLSAKPLVAVGLFSYSLYLWHWPIIVFTHQYLGGPLSALAKAWCIMAAVFASYVSWRFVEQPFRDRQRVSTKSLLVVTSVVTVALAFGAVIVISQKGFPARFTEEVRTLASGSEDSREVPIQCGWDRINDSCHIGKKVKPSFILAGDSFAGALVPAVDIATVSEGGIYNSFNACPALLGWETPSAPLRARRACASRNRALFDRMRDDPSIRRLIIANAWSQQLKTNAPAVRNAVKRTEDYIHGLNKDLVVLYGIPNPGFDVPWALAVNRAHDRLLPAMTRPISEEPALGLSHFARGVDISEALCHGARCKLTTQGMPIFFDAGHLSVTANRDLVAPYLIKVGLFDRRTSKQGEGG